MMLLFLLCLTLAIMAIDASLSIGLKIFAARRSTRPQPTARQILFLNGFTDSEEDKERARRSCNAIRGAYREAALPTPVILTAPHPLNVSTLKPDQADEVARLLKLARDKPARPTR